MTERAKQLLQEGRVQDAIMHATTEKLIERDDSILLNSQFSQINNQFIRGVITQDIYNAEIAKLTQSLLWLIEPKEVNFGDLIEELQRLRSENLDLKSELAFYKDKENNFGGYRFNELFAKFDSVKVSSFLFVEMHLREIGLKSRAVNKIVNGDGVVNLNQLLYHIRDLLSAGYTFKKNDFLKLFKDIASVGLIEASQVNNNESTVTFRLSESGIRYMQGIIKRFE